ncbi:MAG TPA: hypothetical protein VER32_00780 [Pyrinomonadaceae bacterium]|nr:hypothetical protein [Pyrinomonadaceae bacterium]
MQRTPARHGRALQLLALALLVATSAPPPTSARVRRQQTPNVVGVWQAHVAGMPIILRLNSDGTGDFDDEAFKYTVRGASIVVEDEDGVTTYNFTLRGDSLVVSGGDLPGALTFTRLDAPEAGKKEKGGDETPAREGEAAGGEGASEELAGKWCYMASVNTGSGGRMSNRCFTLNADGTFEYHAETSSGGPVASSASQESDSGRWTATATTITSHSSKTGTNTYRLERRNHPKTGDPMLVLDGDAYVTATQRAPWPERERQ